MCLIVYVFDCLGCPQHLELVGWLVGCFVVCLVGWFVGWLVGWLKACYDNYKPWMEAVSPVNHRRSAQKEDTGVGVPEGLSIRIRARQAAKVAKPISLPCRAFQRQVLRPAS